MPHHPSEENTTSHIYDKVAAQSSEGNTSDHPMHAENKEPVKQATVHDYQAGNTGPAHPSGDMPPAKSDQELDAEAKKLNS